MTMHGLPPEATRWSLSLMSRHAGVTWYRVARIWAEANLKPHLLSTFNFSSDPDFAEKVIDIIGLYMDAPEGAQFYGNTKMPFSASFRHICCLALIGSAKPEFLGGVDDVVADEGAGERGAAD